MKSVTKPVRDGAAEGRTGDWGEVVTRYHYRKVGMDHLLSMEKNLIELITKKILVTKIFLNVLLSFERSFLINETLKKIVL